jgi:hypothetical protein
MCCRLLCLQLLTGMHCVPLLLVVLLVLVLLL